MARIESGFPPTHPAIAKLVTLAREVVGYRPPGAT